MVKDRLAELQAKNSQGENNSEMAGHTNMAFDAGEQMGVMLNEVSQIENKILKVRQDVDQMKKQQRDLYFTPVYGQAEVRALERISDQIFTASTGIQKEINGFKAKLKDAGRYGSTYERMMQSHADRLSREITVVMNDFRQAQAEYIDKTQKRYNRQVEIVRGEGEEQETIDLENIQAVFAGNFLQEMEDARSQLRDVEARDKEIKKLEKSVVEVNQLFKELNSMIMSQGEQLDRIETNVTLAADEVVMGNVQLKKAREHQESWRKKKCCLISVCGIIVVIAIIIIVVVIVENNSNNNTTSNTNSNNGGGSSSVATTNSSA